MDHALQTWLRYRSNSLAQADYEARCSSGKGATAPYDFLNHSLESAGFARPRLKTLFIFPELLSLLGCTFVSVFTYFTRPGDP